MNIVGQIKRCTYQSLHVRSRWVDLSPVVVVSINNGLLLFRSEVDAPVYRRQCEPTQAECKAYHQMEGLHCTT